VTHIHPCCNSHPSMLWFTSNTCRQLQLVFKGRFYWFWN